MVTFPPDSRRLTRVLGTAAAYRALDRTQASGGTWCQGGCALLAFALTGLIRGSTVIALCLPPTDPQHLAVQLPDGRYVDGDGISSRHTLLRRWQWIHAERGPLTLRPITLAELDATAIPHRPQDVAIIRRFLVRALRFPTRPTHVPAVARSPAKSERRTA